jgi:hypothetical protein
MSTILWCDEGNHPFSDADPERRRYQETYPSNYQGQQPYEDICGPCYASKQERKQAKMAISQPETMKESLPDE